MERNDALKYYDCDIVIISDNILKSRNIYHLRSMVDDIHAFKQLYRNHKNPVDLQIDYNRLLRLWKETKDSFEIRLAVMN